MHLRHMYSLGASTAPSKSVHLVTQLQHLGNLLSVELSHKLENLLPAKVCLVRIYRGKLLNLDKQSYQHQTNEEELQMHYCQVDRMGADCIKQCSMKMLAKAIGTCTTCVSTIEQE